MRVQLNFARAPFHNERLPWLLYGGAAAVLLAVSVIHGFVLTRYLMREQEELDVKVETLQKELSETEATIRRTEADLQSQKNDVRTERIRFLANVYKLKGFSWTGLFNELETLTPAAVRITSISPAGMSETEADEIQEEIQVELQVVARSLDNVLEMVSRLEEAEYLTTVLPLVEGEGREASEGVSAVLTLRYLPHMRGAALQQEALPDAPPGDENMSADGNKSPASPVNKEQEALHGDQVEVGPAAPGDPRRSQDAKKNRR